MASGTWISRIPPYCQWECVASALSSCTPRLWRFAILCIQRRDWAALPQWCSMRFQSCPRLSRQERGNSSHPGRTQSLPRIHPQCESWSAPSPKSWDLRSSSAIFQLDDSWPWWPKDPGNWSLSIAKSRTGRRRLLCWTASKSLTRWGLQGKPDLHGPLSLTGPGNSNPWHWTKPQHLRRPLSLRGTGTSNSWHFSKPPNLPRPLSWTVAGTSNSWHWTNQQFLRRPLSLRGGVPANPWHWTKPPNLLRPVFLAGRGAPTPWLSPNSASCPKFGCSPGSDTPTRCCPWGRPGFLWCWCHPGRANARHGAHGTPWPRNRGDHGRSGRWMWRRIPSWAKKNRWHDSTHRRGRLFVVGWLLSAEKTILRC